MNVLIGCEFSGVVREAFRKRGHMAYSCDLLPSSDRSAYHLQGPLVYAISRDNGFFFKQLGGHVQWDLGIFHPPCTRLTNAGVRWLYIGGRGTVRDPEKWRELQDAATFFELCLGRDEGRYQDIPRRAVENPIMHEHARELINAPYTQIIQPWQFGHPETKATCFWLMGLPELEPTNIVSGRTPRVHHESPGPDRWKRRSITLPGIAEAMADQWGSL